MMWCYFGLFLLFSSCFAKDGDTLVAYINSKGIRGIVNFEQYNTTTVKMAVNMYGVTNGTMFIDIHEHPTIFENACTEIGKQIFNFTSHIDKVTFNEVYKINQPLSILQGRSLLILNGNRFACATILSKGINNKYAAATISSKMIAGKIEFIQQGAGETVITGQFSHSDGTTVPTSNHKMYIIESRTSEMTPEQECPKTLDQATIYNPANVTGVCFKKSHNTCPIGDLVGKHGPISVGISGNRRFTMIDSNLTLMGKSSVLKRILVITSHLDPKKVLGCGIIMNKGPLQANAEFKAGSSQGISGYVSFSQDSPYHDTKLYVNFSGLSNKAGGFHVHNFPISDARNPCGKESVGGHWNPYNIDAKKSPPPGKGTLDQYESGDLSGKFGYLTGFNSFGYNNIDSNLPMYGQNTLIGRSIVIHSTTGSRLVCANIVPDYSLKLEGYLNYTLQDETLSGFVSLKQYILPNGAITPTLFVVSLSYKGNPNKKTSNHNFHVHTKPLGNDEQHGGKCKSTLGHYNPASVSMTNYKQQCNKNFPYRCELGDLSSKFGTYDIGGGKRFYADEDTPLYGERTVLGRSIVIHAENKSAPRIACADIKPESNNVTTLVVMEGKSSVKDNDRINTMIDIITNKFGWQQKKWKVVYPRLEYDEECFKFSFYFLDEQPSRYALEIEKLRKTMESTFVPCQRKSSSGIASTSSIIVTSMSLLFTYALFM